MQRSPVRSASRMTIATALTLLVTILTGSTAKYNVIDKHIYRSGDAAVEVNALPVGESHRAKIETFIELVENEGYYAEEHEVVTEDDYILKIHRIPGSPKSPPTYGKPSVILLHGLLAASDIWVLRGPEHDLAYMLVDRGYDVWALNSRGNYYGKRHKYLSPRDSQFWRFSWHEIGTYDTAASIDYIIAMTGVSKVSLVGHSMGGTVELVLLSKRPEYNDKIHVALTFAPVAIFTHTPPGLISAIGINYGKQIEEGLRLLDMLELFPRDGVDHRYYDTLCQNPKIQPLCNRFIFYLLGLTDSEGLDPSMVPRLLDHYPQGTSIETLMHYRQLVMSGKFKEYDFGPMSNFLRYKSFEPPEYPLENVTAPVVLYYGPNDAYTTKKDVEAVRRKLPSAISREIPYSNFGHLDFIFLNETKRLLYDDAIQVLNGYRDMSLNEVERHRIT